MNNTVSRRHFIKQGGAAAISLAFFSKIEGKVAPSDRVRIAHIGLGGMGNNHMKWFAALPGADIVALCDVDQEHLDNTMATLKKLRPDNNAQAYGDFRSVLDRKDIDAVTIATPDHWHAQIATLAFKADKDVYGEKPLSYDVHEGQQMLKHQRRNKRVFQLGTQIHAGDNYHRVVELIQAGTIGKVHTVRLWKTGAPPVFSQANIMSPPATLNWDMWLGPAPYTAYDPQRCHFNYRYFLDYSGGVFADFWCHIADVVFWAIQPQGLTSVDARGKAPEGIGSAPEWLDADFQFDGLNIHWTHVPPAVAGAETMGIGAYFEGDKGALICDYNSRKITINGATVTDVEEVPKTLLRSPGHQQNFLDAVKSRNQPESNLEYARAMTLPMHLALISYRLNRKLNWNSKKEKFIDDREANTYLEREYRKQWDLV